MSELIKSEIKSTLEILQNIKEAKYITDEEINCIPQVLDSQLFNGQKKKFDCDSSPKAEDFYKILYSFPINLKSCKKGNNEIWRMIWNNGEIDLAGDCSFNFNHEKVDKFQSILNDSNLNLVQIRKLSVCQRMHHNILNFDLIPVTGGMNNLKGNLKYVTSGNDYIIKVFDLGRRPSNIHDRLDTYISFLDHSLKNRNELNSSGIKKVGIYLSNSIFITALRGENFETLYSFMEQYHDAEQYCNQFYHIDSDFVNRLIDSGKKPIIDAADLDTYMDLAIDYWISKSKTVLMKAK